MLCLPKLNTMKKILIAIDNDPASEQVALKGYQLGKQLGAEIALVSIIDTTALLTDDGLTPGELAEIIRDEYSANQRKIINEVFKERGAKLYLEEGRPHEGILRAADEWKADLIVLGTHGRTGISHLLMGSVAEKVVRHSTRPLYVIPFK